MLLHEKAGNDSGLQEALAKEPAWYAFASGELFAQQRKDYTDCLVQLPPPKPMAPQMQQQPAMTQDMQKILAQLQAMQK